MEVQYNSMKSKTRRWLCIIQLSHSISNPLLYPPRLSRIYYELRDPTVGISSEAPVLGGITPLAAACCSIY